ncbi:hypothetical protein [Streptomyces virginiae]|uniref:hypothetical protein n=1 Tax=Streptomyces virginiae TaxID=1961 RepID=UPI002250DE32|nr:hypothetical protein [Streptomyces virginiae]MCX4960241.1 hypothetical protein [Streptomyces virginiae]
MSLGTDETGATMGRGLRLPPLPGDPPQSAQVADDHSCRADTVPYSRCATDPGPAAVRRGPPRRSIEPLKHTHRVPAALFNE